MTSSRYACIARPERPTVLPGDEVRIGCYWRNIDSGAVKKRYAQDTDPPVWGYRFNPRPDRWGWRAEGDDGLSVNDAATTSAECSVALHTSPDRFTHVAKICLEWLSREMGIDVVAQYSPVELADPAASNHNPFHFVLLPAEDRLDDLLVRLEMLARSGWPSEKKIPKSDADRKKAQEQKARWDRVFPAIEPVSSVALVPFGYSDACLSCQEAAEQTESGLTCLEIVSTEAASPSRDDDRGG